MILLARLAKEAIANSGSEATVSIEDPSAMTQTGGSLEKKMLLLKRIPGARMETEIEAITLLEETVLIETIEG